ncbi:MAG: aspartyl/asparaginyl beta-hydroxylase domain-containing protein [Acidiferrobacterales bacterium]|nr:aspartyl/asparaginyl beta-hydroxylase domain-containing protein [Acidiferrobacterales bacterium]
MLPKNYQKRSFLRFDFEVDSEALLADFNSLGDDVWQTSYWGSIHCSIGMLLLRGGNKGTEFDFFSDEVFDQPVLKKLPYISELIGKNGPFGEATYAFIFKMKANGVTLKHKDIIETWFEMYRIHIPIITNKEAHLIVNNYSQHLASGFAWSFDNQQDHGVVNGDEERVHLIFDVPYSDKMASQIDAATQLEGEKKESHIQRISQNVKAVASYPGDEFIKHGITTLVNRGASFAQIAEIMNAKHIPTKTYPVSKWDSKMVQELY